MSQEVNNEVKNEENQERALADLTTIKKEAKKTYASMGLKLSIFVLLGTALQFLYMGLLPVIFGNEVTSAPWYTWMMIAIPLYALAFPVFLLLTKKNPVTKPQQHKMSIGKFICCIFMSAGIVGVGMVIGTIINLAIVLPFGVSAANSNALASIMINSEPFFRILTVGILAPIFEELIFRKLLIDRVVKHGEFAAILTSGLTFGLFHGNFSQFFFAMGLGMFFSFIYIRTGKVWYTILLHMMINLATSVVTLYLLQNFDTQGATQIAGMDPMAPQTQELVMKILPGMIAFYAWMGLLLVFAVVGIILWICFAKRLFLKKTECEVPKKGRFVTIYGNYGMITFALVAIALFIYTYASMILAA